MSVDRSKQLIEWLEIAGFEPRSYSGRGMFGRSCVSVHGDRDEGVTLWTIATSLYSCNPDGADLIDRIPEPRTDNLGLDYVYYWPSFEWPEEETNAG